MTINAQIEAMNVKEGSSLTDLQSRFSGRKIIYMREVMHLSDKELAF